MLKTWGLARPALVERGTRREGGMRRRKWRRALSGAADKGAMSMSTTLWIPAALPRGLREDLGEGRPHPGGPVGRHQARSGGEAPLS